MKNKNFIFIAGERNNEVEKTLVYILDYLGKTEDFFIVKGKPDEISSSVYLPENAENSVIAIVDFQKAISEQELKETFDLVKGFPANVNLVLNFDDQIARRYLFSAAKVFSFGFGEGADFKASNVKLNGGINFKINYAGKVIPVWLEKINNEEGILPILCALSILNVFKLNILEICQAVKDFPEN